MTNSQKNKNEIRENGPKVASQELISSRQHSSSKDEVPTFQKLYTTGSNRRTSNSRGEKLQGKLWSTKGTYQTLCCMKGKNDWGTRTCLWSMKSLHERNCVLWRRGTGRGRTSWRFVDFTVLQRFWRKWFSCSEEIWTAEKMSSLCVGRVYQAGHGERNGNKTYLFSTFWKARKTTTCPIHSWSTSWTTLKHCERVLGTSKTNVPLEDKNTRRSARM